MDLVAILLIAVGLSMDSLAVAVASGMALKHIGAKGAAKIGVSFGLFQAGMPVIGWFGGSAFIWLISGFDHWVAFLLLAVIGGRMIYEAVWDSDEVSGKNPLVLSHLLIISVATSIDALAVGLGFSALGVPILVPAAVIGFVCFAISFTGAYFGNRAGKYLGSRVRVIGGIILISIGLRILLEHLGLIG
ncbi:MAG: manganese efflux pump MntP family protein [Candidatus Verstraetearchaeota archaeon]|nr:manganese efflux pump MntP family protein [Candidatus Verstraetearchaeota archaeon]